MFRIIIFITLSSISLLHNNKQYAQNSSNFDSLMIANGLVDIQSIDSTISVSLKYSTKDNFTGIDLYGSLERAYFQPNFARMVCKAQQILRREYPEYSLIIYDAARAISVQRKMYDIVKGTKDSIYVANGKYGGRHNYGVAVDLTIIDSSGNELDMGSPFDFFGKASHIGNENKLVRDRVITAQAAKNREILARVMSKAGFARYKREWWHFQESISISTTRKRYRLLNF